MMRSWWPSVVQMLYSQVSMAADHGHTVLPRVLRACNFNLASQINYATSFVAALRRFNT